MSRQQVVLPQWGKFSYELSPAEQETLMQILSLAGVTTAVWWHTPPNQNRTRVKSFKIDNNVSVKDLALKIDSLRGTDIGDYELEVTVARGDTVVGRSTVARLRLLLSTQYDYNLVKTGAAVRYELRAINVASSNRFTWLEYGPGTERNASAILRRVKEYAETLPSPASQNPSAEVLQFVGEQRLQQLYADNIFSVVTDDALVARFLAVAFFLRETAGDVGGASLDHLKNPGTAGDPSWKRLDDLIQNVPGLQDPESNVLMLYLIRIALNHHFGLAGEREYRVLTATGPVLQLDNVKQSATYIAYQRGEPDSQLGLQQIAAAFPPSEQMTLRGVFRVQIVEQLPTLEPTAQWDKRQRDWAELALPEPAMPTPSPRAGPPEYAWREISNTELDSVRAALTSKGLTTIKLEPNVQSFRAYSLKSLSYDEGDQPIPFAMRHDTAAAPVRFDDRLKMFFLPMPYWLRYRVSTSLPSVNVPIGGIAKLDFSNITDGEDVTNWKVTGEQRLTKTFKLTGPLMTITSVGPEHAGTYSVRFQGIPLRITLDVLGTCVRCDTPYTQLQNTHGSCRWHTRHVEEITRKLSAAGLGAGKLSNGDSITLAYAQNVFDPRSPEGNAELFEGITQRNPNIHWGEIVHPNKQSQRQWACCGRDLAHPGCWVGRHNPSTTLPDLQDQLHNDPERGTEHINDLAASAPTHADIVRAWKEQNYAKMLELEAKFNRIHGGVLQPTMKLTAEGRKVLVQILNSEKELSKIYVPGAPKRNVNLAIRKLFQETTWDGRSFGMWQRKRALQLSYVRDGQPEEYDQRYKAIALRIFEGFAELRKEPSSAARRAAFDTWRTASRRRPSSSGWRT